MFRPEKPRDAVLVIAVKLTYFSATGREAILKINLSTGNGGVQEKIGVQADKKETLAQMPQIS